MTDAGKLLGDARTRAGVSQRRLAVRAGTSQDAISRIERGAESPGTERLRRLLLALGVELELAASPIGAPADRRTHREMSAEERLRESASWNLAASRLEIAGAAARAAGHPATRLGRTEQ